MALSIIPVLYILKRDWCKLWWTEDQKVDYWYWADLLNPMKSVDHHIVWMEPEVKTCPSHMMRLLLDQENSFLIENAWHSLKVLRIISSSSSHSMHETHWSHLMLFESAWSPSSGIKLLQAFSIKKWVFQISVLNHTRKLGKRFTSFPHLMLILTK